MTHLERYDSLAGEIRSALDQGAVHLDQEILRVQINALVRFNHLLPKPEIMDSRTLMRELVAAAIKVWPDQTRLKDFEGIERLLLPQKVIREVLNAETLSHWVAIEVGANPDPRIPLSQFKEKLWAAVVRTTV